MSDQTRKHEFELILDAPLEEVWRAVTTGEGIRQWFAPTAEVDPRLGGTVTLGWGPGMEGTAPITAWEPGARFAWTEDHGPNGTRVCEFTLESAGGKTKLRLVHSGFGSGSNFDDEFDSTNGGWLTFLACLRYYVEIRRSAPGRQDTRISMLKGSATDLWARLTDGMGLDTQDWSPGASYRAVLPSGEAISGVVVASPKPRYAVLRVDEMGGSLLAVFCEVFAAGCSLTSSWYLHGAGLAEDAPLLAAWNRYYDSVAEAQTPS